MKLKATYFIFVKLRIDAAIRIIKISNTHPGIVMDKNSH